MRKRPTFAPGVLHQNQLLAKIRYVTRFAVLAALCSNAAALEVPAPQFFIEPISPHPASAKTSLTVPVTTALLADWIKTAKSGSPVGQQAYTTPGTYSWVCPDGVTSVCVVCVGGAAGPGGGGGGLGYKNNISVTPGNSYTVVVGAPGASTGTNGNDSYFINTSTVKGPRGRLAANTPEDYVGDGGGKGGYGAPESSGGGGGAGGYSGNGGNGAGPFDATGSMSGTAGSGGGGGGGGAYDDGINPAVGGGGGGVGILGQGSSGNAGSGTSGGGGGSGGGNGSSGNTGTGNGGNGGNYGGAGGAFNGTSRGGAVRIIWGAGRAFPSTNTGDM